MVEVERPPASASWNWVSAAQGTGPAALLGRGKDGRAGGRGGGALRGAEGKGRRGQFRLRQAEGQWQNLRTRWEAHPQGARTPAAWKRGDTWSPEVRSPAPPPAEEIGEAGGCTGGNSDPARR